MAAVQSNSALPLVYACESLRNDRQVVMAAGGWTSSTQVLHCATTKRSSCVPSGWVTVLMITRRHCCGDREVMLEAVRSCSSPPSTTLLWALRHNTEFQREVVLWDGGVFGSSSPSRRRCPHRCTKTEALCAYSTR